MEMSGSRENYTSKKLFVPFYLQSGIKQFFVVFRYGQWQPRWEGGDWAFLPLKISMRTLAFFLLLVKKLTASSVDSVAWIRIPVDSREENALRRSGSIVKLVSFVREVFRRSTIDLYQYGLILILLIFFPI